MIERYGRAIQDAPRLRLVRFALTGGVAALVQLGLLTWLRMADVAPLFANAVAFLIAAQVNFALSQVFTWTDRRLDVDRGETLARRWVRFIGAISGTAVINMLTFLLARQALPDLAASMLGIAVAGAANYVVADRFVFRQEVSPKSLPPTWTAPTERAARIGRASDAA